VSVFFTFLSILPTFIFVFFTALAKKKEGGKEKKGESNRNVSVLMGLQLPQALDVGLRLCRRLILLPYPCLFPPFHGEDSLEPIGC